MNQRINGKRDIGMKWEDEIAEANKRPPDKAPDKAPVKKEKKKETITYAGMTISKLSEDFERIKKLKEESDSRNKRYKKQFDAMRKGVTPVPIERDWWFKDLGYYN